MPSLFGGLDLPLTARSVALAATPSALRFRANSRRQHRRVVLRIFSLSPCSLNALTRTWTWGCGSSVCSTIAYRCLSANSSLAKFLTAANTLSGGVPAGIENISLWASLGALRFDQDFSSALRRYSSRYRSQS